MFVMRVSRLSRPVTWYVDDARLSAVLHHQHICHMVHRRCGIKMTNGQIIRWRLNVLHSWLLCKQMHLCNEETSTVNSIYKAGIFVN